MDNISLDVTKAIQTLKKQVDIWGKKVSGDGCEYSELYCVKVNDLSQVLGVDVKGYSIKELCNKVLDKAVNLSSSWKYEIKYQLIPNSKRPKEVMFEIGHKLNLVADVNYNNLKIEEDNLMKNSSNEVVSKKKKSKYTEEEFDYLEKLYGNGEDIVSKYYSEDTPRLKKSDKIKLEAMFKMKYPNHKGVSDGEIWYIFYRTRILPYKSVNIDVNGVKDNSVLDIKQHRNIPIYEYVKNIIEYIEKVGLGSHHIEAKLFCTDVIKAYGYLNNKKIGGLCNKMRDCKRYMDNNESCKYTFTFEQHKIKKIDDLSVNNIYFIIHFAEKENKNVIIEDIPSDIEEVITTEYMRYNVEFKIGIYQKGIFKSKLVSTLTLNTDFVVENNITDEQLDKLIRDKIAFVVNQSDLSGKYYYSLQPENDSDYVVKSSSII